MKEPTITALMVAPHQEPQPVQLENQLAALQEAISHGHPHSLIELLGLEPGVDLLLNEEGKLMGLEPNRRLGDDIVMGTFYVVGADEGTGELISLTPTQLAQYTQRFRLADTVAPEDARPLLGFFFLPL